MAQPSRDDAALPRRFRTVLFLDVFGDGVDPTEAELRPGTAWHRDEELRAAERVAGAEAALHVAQAALRRWEAAPRMLLSEPQGAELTRAAGALPLWGLGAL